MSQYKLIGSKPKPFQVTLDNLQVLTTALNIFVSGLAGGLCVYGYSLLNTRITFFKQPGVYQIKLGHLYLQERTSPGTLEKFNRPEKTLQLYEFELCPFCRKVREVISHLNLDVTILPCPKEGKKWRPQLIQKGGKAQFPYLIDPNTGTEMYESDDIIKYLYNNYGPGESQIPLFLKLGKATIGIMWYANYFRTHLGRFSRAGTIPSKALNMYNYEASPFCKYVRENLTELEIPYNQINTARGSPKRQKVYSKYNHFQVPLIEDPNTGIALFESKAIVDYLNKEYGIKSK